MKKIALFPLLLLLVFSFSPLPVPAQSNTKIQDIRKMLELSGSAKIGIQVMRQLLQYQQRANPKVPQKIWENFMDEVNPNELIAMIVPIYARYFSHEDIKGMIRFYQSPVGRKLVSVQSLVARDSMSAGAKWGEAISRKILQKLWEKGYR